jgi:two-component system chemotaxis response regulator CheB
MPQPPLNRDIMVIGASAGGVDALRRLLADLPAELPAAVFVVLHVGEASHLVHVLDRCSRLPVKHAINGEAVEAGQVLVAPPGRHLLLHDGHILLRRGPRENYARPAIDPLFRSAAANFGGRVIGVVLSGDLCDGTAGLGAIKRCGGLTVVQDPEDAAVPTMPLSALRYVEVDHVLPIAGMASQLGTLARQEAGPTPDIPLDIRLEVAIAAQEAGVGSAYAADLVPASPTEEIDRLLGNLLRSREERAGLARRMAERERSGGHNKLAAQLERRMDEYEDDAGLIKRLLRNGERANDMVTSGYLRSSPLHEEEEQR